MCVFSITYVPFNPALGCQQLQVMVSSSSSDIAMLSSELGQEMPCHTVDHHHMFFALP